MTRESLRPVELQILLSMLDGPRHGYAVLRSIGMNVLPGALYRHLRNLADEGLIRETGGGQPHGDDERRRYFELTALGRRVLAREARRLKGIVDVVEKHGLLDRARG